MFWAGDEHVLDLTIAGENAESLKCPAVESAFREGLFEDAARRKVGLEAGHEAGE